MSKVIVLTGGATGMGAATVTRLVAADCDVHVLDVTAPEASEVRLTVYNLLGRRVLTVLNQRMEAGHHTAEWNSRNEQGQAVSSGVYFYRLETPRYTESKKMVLLK